MKLVKECTYYFPPIFKVSQISNFLMNEREREREFENSILNDCAFTLYCAFCELTTQDVDASWCLCLVRLCCLDTYILSLSILSLIESIVLHSPHGNLQWNNCFFFVDLVLLHRHTMCARYMDIVARMAKLYLKINDTVKCQHWQSIIHASSPWHGFCYIVNTKYGLVKNIESSPCIYFNIFVHSYLSNIVLVRRQQIKCQLSNNNGTNNKGTCTEAH